MQLNPVREILNFFAETFDTEKVNWGLQGKIAKSLLTQYTKEEIKFAIAWYKRQEANMYSLGFLKYGDNMKEPICIYHAQKYAEKEGDSGERNRQRIANYSKTKRRTDAPEYLFAETGEAD